MDRIWYTNGQPQPGTDGIYRAVTNNDRRVEVFVVDGLGSLWWAFQPTGQFMLSSWVSLGGLPLPFALQRNAPVAAGVNSDGRVEVFVFSDTHLWHKSQEQPGTQTPAGWGAWEALPLPPVAPRVPVVAQNADGRLEVFAFGTGRKVPLNPSGITGVWHIWQQFPGGGWLPRWEPQVVNSTWQLAPLCSCGAVGRNAANIAGRLEAFTLTAPPNDSSELLHCWQTSPNGGWTDWYSLGRPDGQTFSTSPILPVDAVSTPSVVVNSDGGLDVFVCVVNVYPTVNHICQSTPGGTWSKWEGLDFPLQPSPDSVVCQPAAIRNPLTGYLEVFLVGWDQNLHHITQASSGGWSDWESFGAPPGDHLLFPGAVSLAADFDGRIWAFPRSRFGECYYTPNPPSPPPPQLRTPTVEVNPFPVPLGKSETIHVLARDPADGTALTGTTTILQPSVHSGRVRFDPVATFKVPGSGTVSIHSVFGDGDTQFPHGHFVPDRATEYRAVDYDLV